MTQIYEKPQLTVHGRVENLTQETGLTDQNDFFFFNGQQGNNVNIPGSRDFFQNGNQQGLQDQPATQ